MKQQSCVCASARVCVCVGGLGGRKIERKGKRERKVKRGNKRKEAKNNNFSNQKISLLQTLCPAILYCSREQPTRLFSLYSLPIFNCKELERELSVHKTILTIFTTFTPI